MILDGYRYAKYLDNTGLSSEEYYLLYRIMLQEQNLIDGILKVSAGEKEEAIKQFSKWSQKYQERHRNYLGTDIDWLKICDNLEDKEFLLIHVPLRDRKNRTSYKLSELTVTDKFKSCFLLSDVEQAFYEFKAIYPEWVVIKGARFPSQDKAPEELVKIYDEYVLKGGNALFHERCLLITQRYLSQQESRNAPYKMSNYFKEAYQGIAEVLEKEAQQGDTYEEA